MLECERHLAFRHFSLTLALADSGILLTHNTTQAFGDEVRLVRPHCLPVLNMLIPLLQTP